MPLTGECSGAVLEGGLRLGGQRAEGRLWGWSGALAGKATLGARAGAVGSHTWGLCFQSAKGLHSPSGKGHISCMPGHAPSLCVIGPFF